MIELSYEVARGNRKKGNTMNLDTPTGNLLLENSFVAIVKVMSASLGISEDVLCRDNNFVKAVINADTIYDLFNNEW
jgi:hypothetical protein